LKESLDFIYKEQKELSTLGGVAALLGWDQMTYMPPMGAAERSEQTSLISRLSHEKVISDEFWNHIQTLSNIDIFQQLSEKDQAVVKRLEKDIEKARKIPSSFVEKISKATTLAYPAWQDARNKSDFKIFQPHLEKIVELEKEYCGYINLPGSRYNSLLDDYEEGMTVDRLQKEFAFLKTEIVDILNKIKNSAIYQNQKPFDKTFSVDNQRNLCKIVLERMKLPNESTRLDVSTHPFTTSMGYDDVRITTSFERPNPRFSFFSTIHEAGHALYELGYPRGEYQDTVISDSPSLGMHESQSRFWENMIALSKNFWNYFYPIFQKTNLDQLENIDIEQWYRYINQVSPSFIRVEADELTYCLHVILRFELENMLLGDQIKVSELPNLWNEKMNEMLCITPPSDKEGVLQDMHWSGGNFGYFPTYAIGTIYAAQLFKKLTEINPDIYSEIENGEFGNILNWLRTNVHQYGRLLTADEIIKNCCGEGLNSKVFVDYIKEKYYNIYSI
jgi:carboxypeptidase Taq